MKLEPTFNLVLMERERAEKIGSIIVPEDSQIRNAPLKGKVIAKGWTVEKEIEVGSYYIFGQHVGRWVNSEGNPVAEGDEKKFFLCSEKDLLCKVSP